MCFASSTSRTAPTSTPGTSYRYSNSGYALLALIVEKASGQRFAAFLRERIFAPLGMHEHRRIRGRRFHRSRSRAFGYSAGGGAWTRTDQSSTSAVLGDGGIYSSIDDLAKWDAALYDDRLLREDPASSPSRPPRIPTTRASTTASAGASPAKRSGIRARHAGFRNVIIRYPERKLTVIVLTNRNDPEPYSTALAIARLFLPGAGRVRDPQRRCHPRAAGGHAGRRLLDHAIHAAVLAALLPVRAGARCSATSCRRSTTRSA